MGINKLVYKAVILMGALWNVVQTPQKDHLTNLATFAQKNVRTTCNSIFNPTSVAK